MWLRSLTLLVTLVTISSALECWTQFCTTDSQMTGGFCVQQCTQDEVCYGSYSITNTSTLTPLGPFQCLSSNGDESCLNPRCLLTVGIAGIHHCCCTSDLCNVINDIHPGVTVPPQGTFPTPAGVVPDSSDNVCEVFSDTEHMYRECIGNCTATYKISDGQYELESKSCSEEPDSGCTSECVLDTAGSASESTCCCHSYLCNEYRQLQFTDVSRVSNYVHVSACDTMNCTHACAISNGIARCLCPIGYALRSNGLNCSDIDECLTRPCSYSCENTQGSFQCTCPVDMRLGEDGSSCESTGLVCHIEIISEAIPKVSYCEDLLEQGTTNHVQCHATFRQRSDSTYVPELLGCFLATEENICPTPDSCLLEQHFSVTQQDVYTCCCTTNFCNGKPIFPGMLNSTIEPPTSTASSVTGTTTQFPTMSVISTSVTILITVGLIVVFIVVCVVVVLLLYLCCRKKAGYSPQQATTDFEQPLVDFNEENIALLEEVGHGRFATVYHGKRNEEHVAVKIFQSKESFEKELSIYLSENFEHPNILRFVTSIVKPNSYWLITEFHERGSLFQILNENTVSCREFCNLAESTAAGLAYLHRGTNGYGFSKPSIVHRDLKSKNILVKTNGCCVVSDFGLGITFPLKDAFEGHGQVGTSRYMAPEVLEGRITFTRSAYKQIDSYSLGIILFEVLSRTSTSSEDNIPPYKPPFEERVPQQPSIDDMKKLVSQQQYRPSIPDRFLKDTKFDPITETVTEAWDSNPLSRPSADMVYERVRAFHVKHFGDKTTDSGLDLESPSIASVSSIASPPFDMKGPVKLESTV